MNRKLLIFTLFSMFSCGRATEENNLLTVTPLSPSIYEYIPDDTLYQVKKCRLDFWIIKGFNKRNSKFDIKIDSLVNIMGNSNKNKYPIYGIFFLKEGGAISLNKKYDLKKSLSFLQYNDQLAAQAYFRFGKLWYFVYCEDGVITYNYLTKRPMNELLNSL